MQVNVDHDRVVGRLCLREARIVSLTEDSVKTGGPFKQSKSGNAIAADLKDSLRRSRQVRYGMPVSFYTMLTALLMHDAIQLATQQSSVYPST